MHTDPTLDIFSYVTTSLGNGLHEFEGKTCSLFDTRELERERAARQRRQETVANHGVRPRAAAPGNYAWKPKHLNLNTYKVHALGDYASTIQHYGTTDSYSTQPVSV